MWTVQRLHASAVRMKFLVTDIEFDFEDSLGELSYDEPGMIVAGYLGQ